jgi:integrase
MSVQIDRVRVEARDGFSMPCVTLRDRRAGGSPLVRFIYQRHLEVVLYGRTEGSSGPIWKLLNGSGLGSTALAVNKQAVTSALIMQSEFDTLMKTYKEALPADIVDPCSLGRIRNCTLLPLATAAAIARSFGRSPASMAFLRALSQTVPEAWTLQEEHEQNLANHQLDLVLEDKLEDQADFESEELSFAQELTQMPAFSADKEDETRMQTYIMNPVPSILKSELSAFILYRTATFAARRQGGAVQSISAEHDKTCLLRFFGYLQRTNRIPDDHPLLYINFLLRADLGDLVQAYALWLQNTQKLKFSSIANYLNGIVSLVQYAYANLEPPEAVLNSDPNPLAQIINLRGQSEKASKTQQMYEQRVGGWLTWEDVQKARQRCLEKLGTIGRGSLNEKRSVLRDAAAISLLSLIPPDRVGCIRKLRLYHTLKKKEGGWKIDLSKQRDSHKTSRFYGPFAASLPDALNGVLDAYCAVLELEPGSDEGPYLFHPPQSNFDRPMEPSAWTGWVRRLFKRHHGEEVAPKTLRSVFITWLRDSTDAPQILKSAAHAMKHSEQRQASSDYDQEADDRLVKAAYDFNLSFANQFATASSTGSGAAGSSSSAPPPQPTRRCNFAACAFDPPTDALRDCATCGAPHHHACSIKAGCEETASLCAICLGQPAFEPIELAIDNDGAGSLGDDGGMEQGEEEKAEEEEEAEELVDNGWCSVPGGPFLARLMKPSRQPPAQADWRRFYVTVPFDPNDMDSPLVPGGYIRFPIVAGAPSNGITCKLPASWPTSCKQLIFTLKLSKAGAAERSVTINGAICRVDKPPSDDEEAAAETEPEEEEEVTPTAVAESAMEAVVAEGVMEAVVAESVMEAVGAEEEVTPTAVAESVMEAVGAEEEVTPTAVAESVMEGEAAEQVGVVAGGVPVAGPDDNRAADTTAGVGKALPPGWEMLLHHAPSRTYSTFQGPEGRRARSMAEAWRIHRGESTLAAVATSTPTRTHEHRDPVPPPLPPPPPLRSGRVAKRKERFGDGGELDGPASHWRSAPTTSHRVTVSLTEEIGVPAFATPGNELWAKGWHAGAHKWYKAKVVKLRASFPRIVVKYLADDAGNSHRLALPELDAYLHAGDVRERDW